MVHGSLWQPCLMPALLPPAGPEVNGLIYSQGHFLGPKEVRTLYRLKGSSELTQLLQEGSRNCHPQS